MGAAQAWFAGRLPDDLFTGEASITADPDEIVVIGPIADVDLPKDASESDRAAAREARVKRFREDTRERRMQIAGEAERKFGRKVAWGVRIAGDEYVFTNLSVPVMTRLRIRERAVLDTLVSAGVARSRSDALAWCVKLVSKHQGDWLDDLREAIDAVHKVRAEGPA